MNLTSLDVAANSPYTNTRKSTNNSVNPRVAWRGDKVAVCWESQNAPTVLSDPFGPYPVVGARILNVPSPVGLTITKSGGNVTVAWTGGGTLLSADGLTGPWTPHVGAGSPYTIPASGSAKYFRVGVW